VSASTDATKQTLLKGTAAQSLDLVRNQHIQSRNMHLLEEMIVRTPVFHLQFCLQIFLAFYVALMLCEAHDL
jgi:hypothetical protein